MNINKIILMGRLTADPELRMSQSNVPNIRFTVAVNRRFTRQGENPQADFFSCTAFRNQAEFVSKYFRKGSAICVTGSIQTSTWTDQQGQKRYSTEVVVDEAMFVDARGEGADTGASFNTDAYGAAPSFSSNVGSAPNFEEHNTDDDLPF